MMGKGLINPGQQLSKSTYETQLEVLAQSYEVLSANTAQEILDPLKCFNWVKKKWSPQSLNNSCSLYREKMQFEMII